MTITHSVAAWCRNDGPKVEHISTNIIRESALWGEKESIRLVLQRVGKDLLPRPSIVVTKIERHHLPSLDTKVAWWRAWCRRSGNGVLWFCIGQRGEETTGCSSTARSSEAARSCEAVSIGYLQYKKSSFVKCSDYDDKVWRSFRAEQLGERNRAVTEKRRNRKSSGSTDSKCYTCWRIL